MKIDAQYRSEHALPSGMRVTLRLLAAADREELGRAYRRLSPASRYLRFHASGPNLSDALLDTLMDVDHDRRLAIVAVTDSHDLKSERGVGIARFVRLDASEATAEAAIAVADEAQGQGIGRLLLAALAEAARERGVLAFRGTVLASNAPMRKLLEEAGAVVREDDGETLTFDVPLGTAADDEHDRDSLLRRSFRAFAAYVASLRDKAIAMAPATKGE